MNKLPVISSILLLMALMVACGNPYDIVGDWKTKTDDGNMYLQFEKNDSFRVAFIPDDKNAIGFSCRGGWVINNQEVTINYDLSTFALDSKREINSDNPKNQALLAQKKSDVEHQLLLHDVYVITLTDSNNVLQLVNSSQSLTYHRIDSMPPRLEAPIYLDDSLFTGQMGKQSVEMYLTVEEPEAGRDYASVHGKYDSSNKGKSGTAVSFEGKYFEDQGNKVEFSVTGPHNSTTATFTGTLVRNADGTYILSGNLVDKKGQSLALSLSSSDPKKKKDGDSLLKELMP